MKLRNQCILTNLAIIGGLALELYRGYKWPVLVGVGCVLLILANSIFAYRWRTGSQKVG